jgi:NDP-sugar pyrophosphorylase family protein
VERDLTLLVMAAGKGSRYGGLKQVEPLGPGGETIVDYSVFDALRVGFHRIVFVIRRDIEQVFRDAVGRRVEDNAEVHYVFQDEALPGPFPESSTRKKPWGTAHAVLSAADVLKEPFAVINADDHYGHGSFEVLSEHLQLQSEDAVLVGFYLRNTLSDFGPVKRGLCRVHEGALQSVTELGQIETEGQRVKYASPEGTRGYLNGDETVSMNMWGFHPAVLDGFYDKWEDFIRVSGHSQDAEFLIPQVVTDLIHDGRVACRVPQSPSHWFGMTYREDRPKAVDRIRDLIAQGSYPEKLWPS